MDSANVMSLRRIFPTRVGLETFTSAWIGTFLGNGLILIFSLVTGALLARLLLPAGRGALAAAIYWPHLFAGFGILSLNEAITYRASLHHADIGGIRTAAFLLALVLSTAIVIVGYPLLSILLTGERSHLVPLARAYLVLFIPATFVGLNLLGVDQGCLKFLQFNLLRIVDPLVYLAVVLLMWAMGTVTVHSMACAVLAGTVVSAALRTCLSMKEILLWPKWIEIKNLLVVGARFHLNNIMMYAVTEVDRLVVLLLADNTALGLYVVALTVGNAGLNIITHTFITVMFPYVSSTTDKEEQRLLITKSVQIAALLVGVSTLALAAAVPWLIPLLFGTAYVSAVDLTLVLLIAHAAKGIRQIIGYELKGLGETWANNVADTIGLVLFISSAVPCFLVWDLLGVGWALVFSNVAVLGYLLYFLRSFLGRLSAATA